MKPTTVTTCDDNVPSVALFTDPEALERALFEHYSDVWFEVSARGECPSTWRAIEDALHDQGLMRDRHIAHQREHDLFAVAS